MILQGQNGFNRPAVVSPYKLVGRIEFLMHLKVTKPLGDVWSETGCACQR